MANKGLKGHTKQISQTIGEVAKVSVNVNKTDANMHILIPLFQTLGPNPMDLSLIWNYQDRDRFGFFGKGCNINTYRDFSDNENYISVKEADGSYLSYWDEKGFDDFTSDENNITIVKNTILVPGDSDEYTYEFKDQQGNTIHYDNGNTYFPTSINYVNGEKTTFNGINMDNGRGAKVNFTESNRVMSKTTYTQDGTTLYYVDFTYDSNQRITAVKHFKESKLVKHLSISYGTNEITVKDEVSKDYAKYTFSGNCVTKIVEVLNNNLENAVETSISYEDRRTILTDNDGRKVYIYFDNNNFPLFEIDEDGNAVETEYDATTKKLTAKSSTIPTKKKLENLCTINIGNFSKDSGISTSVVSINDAVLSGVLGTVYKVSGTGSMQYTYTTQGLGSDTIMAVIWGRQKKGYTSSSKVKVTLTADGSDSDEFKKTVVDNQFDMMTLGVNAIKSYSKITLTITLTGNTEIEIGGIQLLKKDFGAFYQYDVNGNVISAESGTGTVSNTYNSKGLQERSVGKDSTLYNFRYDEKGNMISAQTGYGAKIENTYDSYNNITKNLVSNMVGTKRLETTKTYEKGRFITSETDELGNTTSYTYDSFGKIKKITDALNHITEYSYDAFDNLTKILLNHSVSASYTYDAQNKFKTATLPNGTIYSFGYDANNNLNTVSMNGVLIVSFTYDLKTGLITNQKYGSSGDSFDFIYNDKHNISQIKINGELKYQYMYDDFDQLLQVKDGGSTVLKTFTYDNDGQITKTVENGATIEYNYSSLGEVNQRKRTLNSKSIYESFDSISRSKGFSPDNLIGFLQNKENFLGTLFNGSAEIKNKNYVCKPYNYKTNDVTNPSFTSKSKLTCVDCNLWNPISYYPPMGNSYIEDSGCVGFWFYPTSAPTESDKMYLFCVKHRTLPDCVSVYMNSSNKLVLELKDGKNNIITKKTYNEVSICDWNFFGLNFMYRDDGQGYAKIFSYELYLNGKCIKENLAGVTIQTGSASAYHIGYRFNGTSGFDALNTIITALMIGCRLPITSQDMQNFYNYTKDYLIGDSYLDDFSVDFSATTTYNLSENMLNQFDIYPLQNDVMSLKGKKPKGFDLRCVSKTDKDRTFNYNNQIKRYAYVADGNRLEYELNSSTGTIMMRTYIKENADRQYLLECKDSSGNTVGLYRTDSHYLFVEVNGSSTATNYVLDNKKWHTIGLSFTEKTISNSLGNEKYISIRVYKDGNTVTIDNTISTSFGNLTVSIGRKISSVKIVNNFGDYLTYYPLLGQIEMVAIRGAYCEVSTLNTLSKELKSVTKRNEYDELGMLQKKAIRYEEKDILTNTFSYKKRSSNSSCISKHIDTEIIQYGSTKANRSYGIDALGNVTSVTDSTFGSHSYTYNARGFLTKEDSMEYQYDGNGNITKVGKSTYTYDTTIKDRLIKVDDKEITYGSNPLNPESYNGLAYTFEGRRLTSINERGSFKYSYEYNSNGLRISKEKTNLNTKESSKTHYYYDGDNLITEINPTCRLDFLYDENNQLYGFIKDNTDKYFYVRDFMQNILGIIDKTGGLVVKYDYTAYGIIKSITGTLSSTIGNENPFRYKGYYYDKETSMYYCKSRYYVPEWCRWLNGDHVGHLNPEDLDGLNLFSYCENNPVILVDEEGDFAISIGVAIAFGLVALFAMATVAMTKSEISSGLTSDIESGLKSFGDIIVKSVTETIVMTSIPYMLTFVALDNVMMGKKHKEAEHKKNSQPHNLETHQKGQARKQRDKGGEKGDKRRKKKNKWYTTPKFQKDLKKIVNSIAKFF